jgi:AcrR family transcriptional regulator
MGIGAPGTDVGTRTSLVDRVLDATQACCEKWGIAKVTVEDISAVSGVSRATIYRLFPGGKDVLFEALRVRELEDFFAVLRADVQGADSLEELLVRTVVGATRELRADEHLAVMLASEPGTVLGQLTVEGVPRIIRFATAFLTPLADPYLDRARSRELIDVLARLTISYFLAPSDTIDLGDAPSARRFLAPLIAPYVDADVTTAPAPHP